MGNTGPTGLKRVSKCSIYPLYHVEQRTTDRRAFPPARNARRMDGWGSRIGRCGGRNRGKRGEKGRKGEKRGEKGRGKEGREERGKEREKGESERGEVGSIRLCLLISNIYVYRHKLAHISRTARIRALGVCALERAHPGLAIGGYHRFSVTFSIWRLFSTRSMNEW